MSAELIFTTIFASLAAGATTVWLFMTGQLKDKDKELDKKDEIIRLKDEKNDALILKMDKMAEDISNLKVSLAEIKTKNNTLEMFEMTLIRVLNPLKEHKPKDIKIKV